MKLREAASTIFALTAILPLVSLQARKLGVRVNTSIEPGLAPALCDRTMVEQVLLNLARNAMQAMDDPGSSVQSGSLLLPWEYPLYRLTHQYR